jgi:AcrR family transcriptional regulator
MKRQPKETRPRGRPRSASVDKALTEAALEEFTVNGFHGMSMDSIAARAGVSKVSLYRRWGSKLEAAADVMRLMSETSVAEDHGHLSADIQALLQANMGTRDAKTTARVLMRTVGEVAGNPELLAIYHAHLFAPRLRQMRALVERARARHELREDIPVEIAAAMIAGPLFLYLLVLLVDDDVRWPAHRSEEFTRAILHGIGAKTRGRRSP